MNQKLFIIFSFIAVVFLNSCTEKFDNYTVKNAPDAIVIDGVLTDNPGPYTINISKAISYNDANNLPAVTGAKVTISDNQGNQELLKEKTTGNYMTDAHGIRGIVGRNYTLTVQTLDGYVYQSSPCLLSPALQIDSVYGEITNQTSLIDNSPITMPQVQLYVDVSSPSKTNYYFKANLNLIKEVTVAEKIKNSPYNLMSIYHWDYSTVGPVVKLVNGGNTVKKLALGSFEQGDFTVSDSGTYIQETLNGQLLDYLESFRWPIAAANFDGWIATFNVYALNLADYAYYKRMVDQLNAPDRLFDPIPTQLQGNMTCLTDSKKLILGNFTVASKVTKNVMFYDSDNNTLSVKNLLNFPVVNYSGRDSIRPAWWQNFYSKK